MSVEEFGERVRACQARLYRVAVSILRNHADAEDAGSGDFLADGTLVYTQHWRFQPGAFPEGEIAVTPVDPAGERYPEIRMAP